MKKLFDIALHLVSNTILAVLVVLVAQVIVTITACNSGLAPLQQPTVAPLRTFWIPTPQGSEGCPDAVRPGFVPPLEAKSCDIYDQDKVYLGSIRIKGGLFYCSVPQGYVTCLDNEGRRMHPDMTRAMCPFDGPDPSCPPPYWATQKEALEAVRATAEGPQADGAYVACAYSNKGYTCVRSYGAPDGKVQIPPGFFLPPSPPDPT